ncbi:bifunctional p-450: NADPH-p450 reductase [Colletotrichum karsti]|uniref:Bifunctional cytochrome P450/NADPH--P450 reductase n=1 Tax=Colletotrichum karsti TaxID=1095194 RepID=A0A9P6IGW3_9PEZI|nr:bifunctional p-450: NADPH-p450 reductase [Colletotrichum karsti]KAF9882279.1 bifunctional p-450: NADPH-p450 reductase [Colletotrichum karsti]
MPIIGNLKDLDSDDFTGSMVTLAKKLGPIYKLTVAGESFIVLSSWEMINEICDDKRFKKSIDGELQSKGEEEVNWGVARRVLMSAFGPISIRNMFDEMHEISSQLALKWARHGQSQKLDIGEDFTRLALDTVALCSMGFRFNSYYSEELHPMIRAMYETLVTASNKTTRFLPSVFYRSEDKKFAANVKLLRSTAQQVLDARKTEKEDAAGGRNDLLTAMMRGVDQKTGRSMTNESIIDNLITFLVAGHETTASTLQFVIHNLLAHPEAYRKAQEELDTVVGNNALKLDHISKLKYLNAVIRETLRLSSPIPMFARQALKDEVVGKHYAVKANEVLVCLLSKSHRDSHVFGPTAEDFRPERMLDEEFTRTQEEFPHSWSPFGTGMRGCIGRPFAWQEMMITCATLLLNFNFMMDDPSYTLKTKESLTIRPKDFYVRAVLRNGMTPLQLEARLAGAYVKTSPDAGSGAAIATNGSIQHADDSSAERRMAIYYGSNAGTCEYMAHKVASNASHHGYRASIDQLDAARQALPTGIPVVIITSSYEGEPPQNARHFVQWLENLNGSELKNVSYAVYGCGHTDWVQTYQRIPKLVDDALQRFGAERLTPIGTTNVKDRDTFSDFEAWEDSFLWPSIVNRFGGGTRDEHAAIALQIALSNPRVLNLRQAVSEALVTEARALGRGPDGERKRHIEVQLPTGMTYRAGDYLAVLPCNPRSSIDRVMRRFNLAWDAQVLIKSTGPTMLPVDVSVPVSHILDSYVELGQTATKRDIALLAQHANDGMVKNELARMSGDGFQELVRAKHMSILDVVETYPMLRLPFQHFLSLLPPMAMRQYSISSSPLFAHGKATLTYDIINEPAMSGVGQFKGVASNYLSSLTAGNKIQVSVRPTIKFHMPLNADAVPLILIAAGTGIAPFRAFMQERAVCVENGRKIAPAMLFFGCRHPDSDDLYREEFDNWERLGVVTVYRAYSQKKELSAGCSHVQNRLWHERELVGQLWSKDARIYVCGSNKIADSAQAIMVKVTQDTSRRQGQYLSDEEALRSFEQQREERFTTDVFN